MVRLILNVDRRRERQTEKQREEERGEMGRSYSTVWSGVEVRKKLCGHIAQNQLGAEKCLHILTFVQTVETNRFYTAKKSICIYNFLEQ